MATLHQRLRRRFLEIALFLFCLFAAETYLIAQSDLFSASSRIDRLVLPIYLDFGGEPAAILRARSVFTDYQRKGFLRIGLLPMLAVEELEIEISDAAGITNALASMREFLQPRAAGKLLELRQVSVRFRAEKTPRLFAANVRLRDSEHWLLKEVTYRSSNASGEPGAPDATRSQNLYLPQAILCVSGACAGQLAWASSSGPRTENIFRTETIKSSTPTPNQLNETEPPAARRGALSDHAIPSPNL